MPNLEQLRKNWLKSLERKNYRPATLESYHYALGRFFHYLAVEENIDDVRAVTKKTITHYQRWVKERYAPHSQHNYLNVVKNWMEHLEKQGELFLNPCLGMTLPKIGNRLPRKILSQREVLRLLKSPDLSTPEGLRDKAILETFYSTGLRLGEMAKLTVQDVDLPNGLLRINEGKFAKDRVVPLGTAAIESLKTYLRKVRLKWIEHQLEQTALWLARYHPHQPMSRQTLYLMMKKRGKQAGMKKVPAGHVWRHTCATHLVANGAPIAHVQNLLGHTSLYVTQKYTHVALREVKKTIKKAHPRNLSSR